LEKELKALANKRRLMILAFLKKNKEVTVGMIAEEIKLSFKSTSRHLAVLFSAEVLDRDQRNVEVYYSIARDLSETLKSILKVL